MNRKQKEYLERMYEARENTGSLDTLFGSIGQGTLDELVDKVRTGDLSGKDWAFREEVRSWVKEGFPRKLLRYAAGKGEIEGYPGLAASSARVYLSGYDKEEMAVRCRYVLGYAGSNNRVAEEVGNKIVNISSDDPAIPLEEIPENVQMHMVKHENVDFLSGSQYPSVRLELLRKTVEVPEWALDDPDEGVKAAAQKQAALEEFSEQELTFYAMDALLGYPRGEMPEAFPMMFRALDQQSRANLVAGRSGGFYYQLESILPLCSDGDLIMAAKGRFGLNNSVAEGHYTEGALIREMLGRGNPEIDAALVAYNSDYDGHWNALVRVFEENPELATDGVKAQLAVEIAGHAETIHEEDPMLSWCRGLTEDSAISAALQKFDSVKEYQKVCQKKYRTYSQTLANEIEDLQSFAQDLARFSGNWGDAITEVIERSGGTKEMLCESIDTQIQGYAVRLKEYLADPDLADWRDRLLEEAGDLRKIHDAVARLPEGYEFYSHSYDREFEEIMLECMADPGYVEAHPAAAWVMENSYELSKGVRSGMIPEEIRMEMVCEGWCLEMLAEDLSDKVQAALYERGAVEIARPGSPSPEGLEKYLCLHGAYTMPMDEEYIEEAEEFRQEGTPIVDGSKNTRIAYVQTAPFGKAEDLDTLVRDASQGVKEVLVSRGYRDEIEITGEKLQYAAAHFDSTLLAYKFYEAVELLKEADAKGENPFAELPEHAGETKEYLRSERSCAGYAVRIREELWRYSKDAAALFEQYAQADTSVQGVFEAVRQSYEEAYARELTVRPVDGLQMAGQEARQENGQETSMSVAEIREKLVSGKKAEFAELFGRFAGQTDLGLAEARQQDGQRKEEPQTGVQQKTGKKRKKEIEL